MKFCVKCGAQQQDDAMFCPNCGQKAYSEQAATDDSMIKLLCIISYIGPLWLLGLLLNGYKNNANVKFHVGQGIILTIVSAGLGVAAGITGAILGLIFGLISETFAIIIGYLLGLAASGASIYLTVMGIINAAKQQNVNIPFVGQYSFYK